MAADEVRIANFDLKALYRKVWGGPVAPSFPIGGFPDLKNLLPIKPENIDKSLLGIADTREPAKINGRIEQSSMLNAPIHMPVSFGVPGKAPVVLPNEPIVSIMGANEIVTTTINRGKRRGTVKEMINLTDYKINIRGIIINQEEDDYPEQIVRGMRTVLENPGVITIDCLVCRIFNIQLAAVESFRFPRDFGTKLRWCWYEIDLASDEDFEFELINQ